MKKKQNTKNIELILPGTLLKTLEQFACEKGHSKEHEILYRIMDSIEKEHSLSAFYRMKCWIQGQNEKQPNNL